MKQETSNDTKSFSESARKAPLSSNSESLTSYMRRMIADGVTHFALVARVHHVTKDINFYIHPSNVSGDTKDFVLSEDPFNPDFDFIYNKANGWADEETNQKVHEFLALLRGSRGRSPAIATSVTAAGVGSGPLLALRVRSLISDKEMVTAQAAHDLERFGEWRADYASWHRQIEAEIQKLFDSANVRNQPRHEPSRE